MNKSILVTAIFLLSVRPATGMTYSVLGVVANGLGYGLDSVQVTLKNRSVSTYTDSLGNFVLSDNTKSILPSTLIQRSPYFKGPFLILQKFEENDRIGLRFFNSTGRTVLCNSDVSFCKTNCSIDFRQYFKQIGSGFYFIEIQIGEKKYFAKVSVSRGEMAAVSIHGGGNEKENPALKKKTATCDDTLILQKKDYLIKKIALNNCDTSITAIKLFRGGITLLNPKDGDVFKVFDTVRVIVKFNPEDNYTVNLDWYYEGGYPYTRIWYKIQGVWPESAGKDTLFFVIPNEILTSPGTSISRTTTTSIGNIRAYAKENDSIFADLGTSKTFAIIPDSPRVSNFEVSAIDFPGWAIGTFNTYLGSAYSYIIGGCTSLYMHLGMREGSYQRFSLDSNKIIECSVMDYGPDSVSSQAMYKKTKSDFDTSGWTSEIHFSDFDTNTAVGFTPDTSVSSYLFSYAWFGKFYFEFRTDLKTDPSLSAVHQLLLILKSKFDSIEK